MLWLSQIYHQFCLRQKQSPHRRLITKLVGYRQGVTVPLPSFRIVSLGSRLFSQCMIACFTSLIQSFCLVILPLLLQDVRPVMGKAHHTDFVCRRLRTFTGPAVQGQTLRPVPASIEKGPQCILKGYHELPGFSLVAFLHCFPKVRQLILQGLGVVGLSLGKRQARGNRFVPGLLEKSDICTLYDPGFYFTHCRRPTAHVRSSRNMLMRRWRLSTPRRW